jgi:hypothetical protein
LLRATIDRIKASGGSRFYEIAKKVTFYWRNKNGTAMSGGVASFFAHVCCAVGCVMLTKKRKNEWNE